MDGKPEGVGKEGDGLGRYSRQVLLPFLGAEGQRRIGASSVLLAGCGALGTVAANLLVRAGLGRLVVVDRDFVEWTNLQRQVLFDEGDCRAHLPKAVAAERKLRAINGTVAIEGRVADICPTNIEALVDGATVVVDGTDNFETRFLINDICVKRGLPWVYGAAVGSQGLSLTIVPGRSPCLRCIFPSPPPLGSTPTCETAGVWGPITGVIGNWQTSEALKICAGQAEQVSTTLFSMDLWSGEVQQLKVAKAKEEGDCPCCGRGLFEYLEGNAFRPATTLCGREAIQITPTPGLTLDMTALAARLKETPGVTALLLNRWLLKFQLPSPEREGKSLELTVFPDGRVMVLGTRSETVARTAAAKFIGF